MANEKLQVGRALAVIPSDTVDIPFPSVVQTGIATGGSATTLQDVFGDFINMGVKAGDIIYSSSANDAATVVAVTSATELSTTGMTFGLGDAYTVYAGGNNSGCVLFIGGGGDLTVETVGGDIVTFSGVVTGQFIPVQVKKVLVATSAFSIVALW